MKYLFALMAVIEAATGLALLATPMLAVRLLLGVEMDGAAFPLARIAGAGLLSLGVACWTARSATSAAGLDVAMLVYNLGAALVLAAAGFQFPAGALLWIAVVAHAAIAVGCAASVFKKTAKAV